MIEIAIITIVGIALVAAMFGAIVGATAVYWLSSSRFRDQTATLSSFGTTVTHMCPDSSCVTELSWAIARWNQDADIVLVSEKSGGASQSFIPTPEAAPLGSLFISGTDERVFFDGPGAYRLTMTMQGNASGSRSVDIFLLGDTAPVVVSEQVQVSFGAPAADRRQVSATTVLDVGVAAGQGGEKSDLRFCKDTFLSAIRLREATYAQTIPDPPASLGEQEDDPNAAQPQEIEITLRQDGNDIDRFTLRIGGGNDVRQLPASLEVDQPIELVGTRTSGPAPFFPTSVVGWALELTFSCGLQQETE